MLTPAALRFSIREIMLLTAAIAAFLAWANLAYQRSWPYQRTAIPDRLSTMNDIQGISTSLGHQPSSYTSGGGGSSDMHATTRTYECHIDLPAALRPQFLSKYREHVRAVLEKHAERVSGGGTMSDGAGLRGFELDYTQGRSRGTVIVRTAGGDRDLSLFLFVHEFEAQP